MSVGKWISILQRETVLPDWGTQKKKKTNVETGCFAIQGLKGWSDDLCHLPRDLPFAAVVFYFCFSKSPHQAV